MDFDDGAFLWDLEHELFGVLDPMGTAEPAYRERWVGEA